MIDGGGEVMVVEDERRGRRGKAVDMANQSGGAPPVEMTTVLGASGPRLSLLRHCPTRNTGFSYITEITMHEA